MSDTTVEAIVEAVSKTYIGLAVYEDVGTVSYGSTPEVRFETHFRRGNLFEFAYAGLQGDGTYQPRGRVRWENGRLSFWTLFNGPQVSSLEHAVAALTGISRGSAHAVPSLLLPKEIGGLLPTDLLRPVRLGDETVSGVLCYHIQGSHKNTPSTRSLFIDKGSYLIRRLVSHEGGQVTEYEVPIVAPLP